MKALIIEDEVNVREGFLKMLSVFCPEVEVVGSAGDVESGLALIQSTEFDILFLDINLPDGSGFDLLYRLDERNFHVIFITAYDQYAIDAFKISAIDYLLKPVSPDLLRKAIQKVDGKMKAHTDESLKVAKQSFNRSFDPSEKIILRDSDSIQMVVIGNITYCEADGSYTIFHLSDSKKILTSMHLKEYERILEPYGFVRSHHSYLINLNQVISVQKSDGGTILMNGRDSLPISTRKRSAVINALKNRFIS